MAEIDDLNVATAKIQDDVAMIATAVAAQKQIIADQKQTIADLQKALADNDPAALKAQIATATEALNKADADLDAIVTPA